MKRLFGWMPAITAMVQGPWGGKNDGPGGDGQKGSDGGPRNPWTQPGKPGGSGQKGPSAIEELLRRGRESFGQGGGGRDGGFGGMPSFEVIGDFEKAKRVTGATQLFQLAVSLGAVESLIEQPASMSHASYDRDVRLAHGISDELIRLSVGLEDVDDLITDLELALDN